MNSLIINTLKNRSKQNILESADQIQNESQNLKFKQVEKQIMTMVLLVTNIYTVLVCVVKLNPSQNWVSARSVRRARVV